MSSSGAAYSARTIVHSGDNKVTKPSAGISRPSFIKTAIAKADIEPQEPQSPFE